MKRVSIPSFIFRPLFLLGLVIMATTFYADALPVEQETLGAWHYCLPLDTYEGGGAQHSHPMFTPTAVEFGGGRIAVILPGSEKVAEFKAGAFDELALPANESPLSLATDQHGKLYCLLQRSDHLRRKDGWRERWVVAWTDGAGWTQAIQIPFQGADHLEFDTTNRLWALGPAPAVAVLIGGHWDTYQYNKDGRLDFAPVRLAQDQNGKVTLFSYWRENVSWQPSHLVGALCYQNNRFTASPQQDVTALRVEQRLKEDLLANDNFERRTGYICRSEALNTHRSQPLTVLRTAAYALVSFNNDGLAWTDNQALQTATLPDEIHEWERLDDVCVHPTLARGGTLWLARDNPRRMIRVDKESTQEYPAEKLAASMTWSVIEVDQLGRPWVHSSNLQSATACLIDGKLKVYDSEPEALLAEGDHLPSGRVFPESDLAIKTPDGTFCMLDYEHFAVGDVQGKIYVFDAEQISPRNAKHIPSRGHGYNAFRGGAPKFDEDGNIYTAVDGQSFHYHHGRWQAVMLSPALQTKLQPPNSVDKEGEVLGAYETRVRSLDGRSRLFRRLHFYEQSTTGQWEPIDHGINPLAYYPFWTGWFESPGLTEPLVDPKGRLWISPAGPYADNRVWMVRRE